MQMPLGHRSTSLVVALAAALFGSLAHAGGDAARARQIVDGRNRELDARLKALRATSAKRLGGVKARTTRVGTKDDSVIFRQPSRGLNKGLRSNRVMQILTTELGDPHMVPPAVKHTVGKAVGEFSAGEEIMVMGDEKDGFRGADEVPQDWLDAIGEETRLIAATVDLLVQYRDRKMANLMVNSKGRVRLIDPDSTFVSRSNGAAYRSQFFPGMKVGYRSRQAKLSDLPPAAQTLVTTLADSRLEDVARSYAVDEEEAGVMQKHARAIRDHGLTAAVEGYVSTLTLKPSR
jgi:hypothetical protein